MSLIWMHDFDSILHVILSKKVCAMICDFWICVWMFMRRKTNLILLDTWLRLVVVFVSGKNIIFPNGWSSTMCTH